MLLYYQIINVDALTYAGNPENLNSIVNHPNYIFAKADITDCQAINFLMSQGIDVVV